MKYFDCFLPSARDHFLGAYENSQWLLMPKSIDSPESILSWDGLSDMLSTLNIPGRDLAFAKNEDYFNPILPLEAHRGSSIKAQENRSNVPQIFSQLISEGYTLIVNKSYKYHPPINAFCRELAVATRTDVHANIYASWGPSSPFPAHWDEHDVLILQLAGKKRWWVYGSDDTNPVSHQQAKAGCPSNALWEGELNTGDALYIPRGCYHKASADAEPSLHVTVGIYRLTGLDVIHWIAEEARRLEGCRANVPHLSDKIQLSDFLKRISLLIGTIDINPESFERFALDKITNRPHISLAPLTAQRLDPGTLLTREFVVNPFVSCEFPSQSEDFVTYIGARQILTPAALSTVLKRLISGAVYRGQEIVDRMIDAGALPDEAGATLSDMLNEGVIHCR